MIVSSFYSTALMGQVPWFWLGAPGDDIYTNNTTPFENAEVIVDPDPLGNGPFAIGGFRVRNGYSIFEQGTNTITSPNAGAGTMFYWIPDFGALRFGRNNSGTVWNPGTNVGLYSFGTGYNTVASGHNSSSFGDFTTASANSAFSHGTRTHASGFNSVAMGNYSEARANACFAVGNWCVAGVSGVNGHNSFATGNLTNATGASSFSCGTQSTAHNWNSFAGGYGNEALGIGSLCFGHWNEAIADYSFALGYNTKSGSTASLGRASVTFGLMTETHSDYSFALGHGTKTKGKQSIASGFFTEAEDINSMTIGEYTHTDPAAANSFAMGSCSFANLKTGHGSLQINHQGVNGEVLYYRLIIDGKIFRVLKMLRLE